MSLGVILAPPSPTVPTLIYYAYIKKNWFGIFKHAAHIYIYIHK